MLKIENIVKSFDNKKAVCDLSFQMKSPGVFGLIGSNGAGKTTGIRCILGIIEPDSGFAGWNGKKITRESLSFGYMPEERGIYSKIKVLEQLIYFGKLRGMNSIEAKKSAVEYMKKLNVLEYKDVVAEKLSKGNQQKIQLIATIIHNPQLIFLDEPFSGLDPVNADVLKKLIEELVYEGKYIVMSSHQMNIVEDYCKDIVLLHKGKTLLNGNLNEIKKSYGYSSLIVSASEKAEKIASDIGLVMKSKTAKETEYAIDNEKTAGEYLQSMVTNGVIPLRFQIKEPSLHEIFVKEVGENI